MTLKNHTARWSAISLIANNIGINKLIYRLIKGCYRNLPNLAKYRYTWDVDTVFVYLEQLNDDLFLKKSLLIALATAQRSQTIAKIEIKNIIINESKIDIIITKSIKTLRAGWSQPVLHLPNFDERPKLCVFWCLQAYLDWTRPIRGNDKYLSLAITSPYKSVGSLTISNWIEKIFLSKAGIDTDMF